MAVFFSKYTPYLMLQLSVFVLFYTLFVSKILIEKITELSSELSNQSHTKRSILFQKQKELKTDLLNAILFGGTIWTHTREYSSDRCELCILSIILPLKCFFPCLLDFKIQKREKAAWWWWWQRQVEWARRWVLRCRVRRLYTSWKDRYKRGASEGYYNI